jgi:integrase
VSKSTGSRTSRKVPRKPNKPYKEFPLYPHPLGYWSKKVSGRLLHFGRWGRVVNRVVTPLEDQEAAWREALRVYKARIDDAQAGDIGPGPVVGEKTEATAECYLIKDLCNEFRSAKLRQKDNGELTPRMYAEYVLMCDMVVEQFGRDRRVDGLEPSDFKALRETMTKRWGHLRVLNGVTRVKTIFKYAYEQGKIDRLPRYGQDFKPPSRLQLRRHKAKAGPKMFERAEVLAMIDGATVQGERENAEAEEVKTDVTLRAMILLAVNCGFGNDDVAGLTEAGLNLDDGWLDYPRAKTGIQRRCPLWPETVAAIRAALAVRPKPVGVEDCGLIFLTYRGTRWVRMGDKSRSDYVSQAFNKLLKRLKLTKPRCGFYTLRHVFRTIADGAKDIPAVRTIMGHVDSGIDATYRERMEDSRLRAVADHVRKWLWPDRV